jgi:exodeoxyribonuclease VII small subunit
MSFEKRLERLEAIIGQLEHEQVDLSRALALFEEGVECLRDANEQLARVEERVRILSERADGTFETGALDG